MKKLLAFVFLMVFATLSIPQQAPPLLKVNRQQTDNMEVEAAMYSYNQDNTMTPAELLDDVKRLKRSPANELLLTSKVQMEIWCAYPPYRKTIETNTTYKCVASLDISPAEMEELTVRYRQRRARILAIIDQPKRR